MQQRDLASVNDMLDAARDAVALVSSKADIGELEADTTMQWALAYRLIVIGEATRRVSASFCDEYPEIPWLDARDMRNVVVHEYDRIVLAVLWKTVRDDLPPLIEQLERILAE